MPLFIYVGQTFQSIYGFCDVPNPVKDDSSSQKPLEKSTPLPEDDPLDQHYFEQAKSFSFYQNLANSFIQLTQEKSPEGWEKPKAQQFLYEELNQILEALNNSKFDNNQGSHESLQYNEESLLELETSILQLKKEIQDSLKRISRNCKDKPNPEHSEVSGIQNVGNTCYINAALQPLIAIQRFQGLIPEEVSQEPQNTYEKRQAILQDFKKFAEAKQNGASPQELGSLVGQLRSTIFKVALDEGGFISPEGKMRFQDAGQFFELILYVLNRGFQLEISRSPLGKDENIIPFRAGESTITARSETELHGVFYLQLPGTTLQDRVDQYKAPAVRTFSPGNEWRIKSEGGQQLSISSYQETNKIIGEPPKVLVVRVDNYVVEKSDLTIDFSPLFKDSSEDCCYQISGFSQNHHQVHWTSVVYDGEKWKYCDDASVRDISPEDPLYKLPATYIVFENLVK